MFIFCIIPKETSILAIGQQKGERAMTEFIDTTRPNSKGEMLWCVRFVGSYYDNDPRMPGTVPVQSRSFVLAKSRDEAISKAGPDIAAAREKADKGAKMSVEATIVTIESLVAARNSVNDGVMGWVSNHGLTEVSLSHPDDRKRYRLAVCLVSVE